MLKRVLIANRGEIAVRIIRACQELGIQTIAVYNEADRGAPHTSLADESRLLAGETLAETYLNIEAIVAAARESEADAIHPGYGFLSENAAFVEATNAANIRFVGPSADAISTMGDKTRAREAAAAAGVPLLPGSPLTREPADLVALADEVGYPVVVKAAFGGGGRGMRVVTEPEALLAAATSASEESAKAFGRPEVYLERYLPEARHVEVQVLGDTAGNIVVVGDRDCSVQRRHQKLLEEAPAPDLPDAVRAEMHRASAALASRIGYVGAGTVEFMYSPKTGDIAFLEMNTRLQVEHGITELVTGVDLVHEQLRIAAGEPISFGQDDVTIAGHAIQARIAAEDPWNSFLPATGTIRKIELPSRPGVRNDFGVRTGSVVTPNFDSMLGKVLVVAPTRQEAAARLDRALQELIVDGLPTTKEYLQLVLRQPSYLALEYSTNTVDELWIPERLGDAPVHDLPDVTPELAYATGPRVTQRDVVIDTDRGPVQLTITGVALSSDAAAAARGTGRDARKGTRAKLRGEPVAPMDAVVSKVLVQEGDVVAAGDVLAVLEAMKMEMPVKAAIAGTVREVLVVGGSRVSSGELLLTLDPIETEAS